MDLPLPVRRVLVILGTAFAVGAIGLVIAAMRNAAPTPVRPIGQPSTGEPSQPGGDLQAMLNSAGKPSQPGGALKAVLPNPQSGDLRGAEVNPISQSTATSPRSLRVHVAGAARHTGVYTLPAGARVEDAVTAAGGATASADLDAINLADFLKDGEQIRIPRKGETERKPTTRQPTGTATSARRSVARDSDGHAASDAEASGDAGHHTRASKESQIAAAVAADGKIDLNSATLEQLETLPGVGPSTAQTIIDHRTEHGRFLRIEDLMEVRGIREKRFARLKDYITVR